jgi:hypothetical protein
LVRILRPIEENYRIWNEIDERRKKVPPDPLRVIAADLGMSKQAVSHFYAKGPERKVGGRPRTGHISARARLTERLVAWQTRRAQALSLRKDTTRIDARIADLESQLNAE